MYSLVNDSDNAYYEKPLLSRWRTIANHTLTLPGLIFFAVSAALLFIRSRNFTPEASILYNHGSTDNALNATLGFGAILLLSLPERTDRQDAVSLISSITGINISKTIHAIHGEGIAAKARPFGAAELSDPYLGSWRTHMDALRYVVDNRIETALLLEDDVDWDVRIKPQFAALSAGLAASRLRNVSIMADSRYPYGRDWDILHLGASWFLPAPEPFGSLHAPYYDADRPREAGCPRGPGVKGAFCWDPLLDKLHIASDTRTILPSHDSVGLVAIAVTYEGARRILYQLSWVGLDTTLDWGIRNLLMDGRIAGWTIVPPLFSQFKVGGSLDSDLDTNTATFFGDVKSNLDGVSPGLDQSARKALTASLAPRPDQPGRWSDEYWESLGIVHGAGRNTRH